MTFKQVGIGSLKPLGFTTQTICMSKIITVKEAIEQGYIYFAQGKGEFQHLHSIEDINKCDFEYGPLFVAEKDSYYTPNISPEEIAETLADIVSAQNGDETGDDTDDVYDIVKRLDFTAAANLVNEALKNKKYYKLTDIQLIPNEQ